MSRVCFHSPSGEAAISGSERRWLARLARGPSMSAWGLDRYGMERAAEIAAMVPEGPTTRDLHKALREGLRQDAANNAFFEAWPWGAPKPITPEPDYRLVDQAVRMLIRRLEWPYDFVFRVVGSDLDALDVHLNTALASGSDPVRLAAKIDGWCESHCWVEGPDRAWMATVIDEGLRAGMYRRGAWCADELDGPRAKVAGQGWAKVLELLRASDDEPVVLSYSTGWRFPGAAMAELCEYPDDDSAWDRWHGLGDREQWMLGTAWLRQHRPWARLSPQTLAGVTFGPPVTVYDLLAPDRDERVLAALESPLVGD